MGTRITLPQAFTASTGKFIVNDEIMPLAGALCLFDASHSVGGMGTAGVPADLATLPNIAWDQAAAAIGSGSQSSLGLTFDRFDGTNFNLERTGKGGIHGFLSGNIAQNIGVSLNMPSALRTYLYNNRTNKFYFSAWDKVTKVAVQTGGVWPMFEGIQKSSSSTSQFLAYFDPSSSDGGQPAPGGAARLGARIAPAKNSVGNTYRSLGVNGWTGGTPPASASEINSNLAIWGSMGPYAGFLGGTTGAPSFVLYRMYMEDLTVSGRTWEQVDAIDYSLWQREFAAGGKYFNDTHTASPI